MGRWLVVVVVLAVVVMEGWDLLMDVMRLLLLREMAVVLGREMGLEVDLMVGLLLLLVIGMVVAEALQLLQLLMLGLLLLLLLLQVVMQVWGVGMELGGRVVCGCVTTVVIVVITVF